jgi:hypothetical protein
VVARCKLDSHADTSVAGRNFVMIESTNRSVNVSGYSPELDVIKNIPIATAATVYVNTRGANYLLILHECLFFGHRMQHSFLCPNQLRVNNVIVNDTPRQFDKDSTHSIIIDDVTIPLDMRGVVSYFETRAPRQDDNDNLPQLHLTAASDWTHLSATLSQHEDQFPPRVSYLCTDPPPRSPYPPTASVPFNT